MASGVTRIDLGKKSTVSAEPTRDGSVNTDQTSHLLHDHGRGIVWKLSSEGEVLTIESLSDLAFGERKHHFNMGRKIELNGAILYRGEDFDILSGAVVLIDSIHGDIWSISRKEGKFGAPQRIGKTSRYLEGIGVDSNGEPLFVVDGGAVIRMVVNDNALSQTQLPKKLNETGLYLEGISATELTIPQQ